MPNITRILERKRRFESNEFRFLGVYTVTRHYGGPEEGGWWYDHRSHEVSVRTRVDISDEALDERKQQLRAEYEHEEYGNIGSVLGGQAVEILREQKPAQWETRTRPRYE